jgi:hypothetical protein
MVIFIVTLLKVTAERFKSRILFQGSQMMNSLGDDVDTRESFPYTAARERDIYPNKPSAPASGGADHEKET